MSIYYCECCNRKTAIRANSVCSDCKGYPDLRIPDRVLPKFDLRTLAVKYTKGTLTPEERVAFLRVFTGVMGREFVEWLCWSKTEENRAFEEILLARFSVERLLGFGFRLPQIRT